MGVAAESTETLLAGLEAALSRADLDRPTRLVSATVEIDPDVDPAALAVGVEAGGGPLVLLGAAGSRGFAIAGIGAATAVIAGERSASRTWRSGAPRAVHDREAEEPARAAAGRRAGLGRGASRSPIGGGSDPHWSSLPPALAVLPEVSIARGPEGAFLTASIFLEPGTDPEQPDAARRRQDRGSARGRSHARRPAPECGHSDLRPLLPRALREDRGRGGRAHPLHGHREGRARARADGRGPRSP